MRRIIINNLTEFDDVIVLDFVRRLIVEGSNSKNEKNYSSLAFVEYEGKEYFIEVRVTKCSVIFTFKK